jgi:hypothetical protein
MKLAPAIDGRHITTCWLQTPSKFEVGDSQILPILSLDSFTIVVNAFELLFVFKAKSKFEYRSHTQILPVSAKLYLHYFTIIWAGPCRIISHMSDARYPFGVIIAISYDKIGSCL